MARGSPCWLLRSTPTVEDTAITVGAADMATIAVGMEAITIVAMGITDRIIGRFTIIRLLATAPLITARPRRSFFGFGFR